MKKILILFIVALIVVGGYSKAHNSNARTITPVEEKQLKELNENQKRLDELKKLQSLEIVEGKLRSVGKLTVLEGEIKYTSKITDTFIKIPIRGMTLDLNYSYGIGMSLEYIRVVSTINNILVLEIPINRLHLQYIQMDSQSSQIVNGKKIFLVSQFKPSEVQELIEDSQQKVVNYIGADQKYWMLATNNLKSELEKLGRSFGFEKVIFKEV